MELNGPFLVIQIPFSFLRSPLYMGIAPHYFVVCAACLQTMVFLANLGSKGKEAEKKLDKSVETVGIDPTTCRMLSGRSTI